MQLQQQLPPTAQAIASVIGIDKTMELVSNKRQTRSRTLHVPHPERLRPSHWLIQTLGEKAAFELAHEYAGETLSIPRCTHLAKQERNRRIINMRHNGSTYSEIASGMSMTISAVKMVYRRWFNQQQTTLGADN